MRGRKKSEETRLAILRHATAVFSERPFHEVLTDDISSRLGVGKGTLYRYFASKEELYFATIIHGLDGMREAIDLCLGEDAPLEQTIESLAVTVIGYFWERRDFFVLLHRHEAKLEPTERAEWQKGREELVSMVAERISSELNGNGARGVNARLAAEMLFGMIRSVCLYRDESDRIDDLARLVRVVFLHGVAPNLPVPRPARAPLMRRAASKG